MNKVLASVLALSVAAAAGACGGIPGMECKFNKGEVADVNGDVKAFLTSAMELKKASDALEADWSAEIKAMGGDLSVDNPNEENVLAKLSANVTELKAKGQCTVSFNADLDAGASGSASGDAAASSDKGSSADGNAQGAAYVAVKVDFDMKCSAEASVKGELDVTTATVKAHFPKLLGIAVKYKDLAPKFKEVGEAGSKLVSSVGSDVKALSEVKCAVSAVTGVKVDARVSFSVHASASAKGEAGGNAAAGG